MKYPLLLVGVLFCFLLGYLLEPSLRSAKITEGEKPEAVEPVATEPPPQAGAEPIADPEPTPEIERPTEPEPPTETEPPAVVEIPALPAPTDNEIRQIMYESVQKAEIDHFTIGQITQWKNFGEEQIDGVSYRFGLIDYRQQTIFGEREVEAKALIRDGKVEKWIWTSNGMRIP